MFNHRASFRFPATILPSQIFGQFVFDAFTIADEFTMQRDPFAVDCERDSGTANK
jgi:hypothetical protein